MIVNDPRRVGRNGCLSSGFWRPLRAAATQRGRRIIGVSSGGPSWAPEDKHPFRPSQDLNCVASSVSEVDPYGGLD